MIPRRVCGYSSVCFFIRERKYCIGGTSEFESSHLLKVFALEKQFGIDHSVEAFAGQYWSAVYKRFDPLSGFSDGFNVRDRVGIFLVHILLRFDGDLKPPPQPSPVDGGRGGVELCRDRACSCPNFSRRAGSRKAGKADSHPANGGIPTKTYHSN